MYHNMQCNPAGSSCPSYIGVTCKDFTEFCLNLTWKGPIRGNEDTMLDAVILIIAAFAAGLLSGTVGFGGSMILLPAMTSCYGIEVAVPMSTIAQLLSNLFRVGAGFRCIRWRKAAFFLILAAPLTLLGAYWFVVVPKELMTRILCLLLIVFAFLDMTQKLKLPRSRWTMLAGGGISGIINGLLSLSGPISSAVFLTLGLAPVAYIATEAAAATVMHIIQLAAYGGFGLISKDIIFEGVYTGAAMILGNWIAIRRIKTVKRKIYRRSVAIVMIICSIWLFMSV